ncbi:uncharacterized protein ASPGLDRAFT_1498181 [Aspergillus glaucus CBS 516.65]|uniref:Uncharacterized protein n=1 Tax=Aspergillus glaucus CBS 516.65 TaxID=1160497 RepID=A0A1L9VBH2_ASPGL|nr:hypothetical protein ASPGLDRAFT_1498181 [Aspergillus glaucus CBS 516.65]OJJ81281.1 hypothetical protein ASPGLDRAFT_1498181 [Aspergillus glaucus CBS 516.65]
MKGLGFPPRRSMYGAGPTGPECRSPLSELGDSVIAVLVTGLGVMATESGSSESIVNVNIWSIPIFSELTIGITQFRVCLINSSSVPYSFSDCTANYVHIKKHFNGHKPVAPFTNNSTQFHLHHHMFAKMQPSASEYRKQLFTIVIGGKATQVATNPTPRQNISILPTKWFFPIFEGVSQRIPLPDRINKNKPDILNIVRNHTLMTKVCWPEFQVESKHTMPHQTISTLKLKSFVTPVIRQVTLEDFDDGLSIYEEMGSGVTCHVDWTISRGHAANSEAGFTLDEFYVVRGSRRMRVDTMIYNNHQPQTMMFIVYIEKISNECTNIVDQVRRQLEKFKEA